MPLTGATVKAALAAVGALGKQIRSVDELAAGATDALRQAPPGLTPAGAAAFLATCAVESGWFRTTEEYGGPKTRYAPFYGRTFVQLTWEANYRGFGTWCRGKGLVADPAVFVKNPAGLGEFRWAWLGAVYYFEAHNIWRWANAGNFRAASQAVNGGNGRVGTAFTPNGWPERQAMYGVFLPVGAALLPGGRPTTAVTSTAGLAKLDEGATGDLVAAWQRWLNTTFPSYSQIDLAPRRYGPQTVSVVREWQRRSKLHDDGVMGLASWAEAARQGFRP